MKKSNKKIIFVTLASLFLITVISVGSVLFASAVSAKKEIPLTDEQICKILNDLPDSAKYNSELNEFYDSAFKEWDVKNHTYIATQGLTDNQNKITKQKSIEEWLNENNDSTDEVISALKKYNKARTQSLNNDPSIMLRSDWAINNNGELDILTSLGVKNVRKLMGHIDSSSLFSAPAFFAVQKICKIENNFYFPQYSENQNVHLEFANKKLKASGDIQKCISDANLTDEQISEIIKNYGVLGLPEMYNQIIKKNKIKLLKFAALVLPDELLKENLPNDASDECLLKCLKNIKEYIDIINKL